MRVEWVDADGVHMVADFDVVESSWGPPFTAEEYRMPELWQGVGMTEEEIGDVGLRANRRTVEALLAGGSATLHYEVVPEPPERADDQTEGLADRGLRRASVELLWREKPDAR